MKSYVWNSVGGMLNAGQSVLILIVITRACGLEAAGIFSIAYATANLLLYLGNYGVRNYQVSDLKEAQSFQTYLTHRIITTAAMLAAGGVYCAWSLRFGGYSGQKAAVVFAMCALKAVDCIEEVIEGRLHQRGRLDLSGKIMTARIVISIGGMIAALMMTGDLLASTWVAFVFAVLTDAVMAFLYRKEIALTRHKMDGKGLLVLTTACFPVCAANFLSFYLTSAPKYAIDAWMSETVQAQYNFIAMPVFVIQLLNMFMYQPVLVKMTIAWTEKNKKSFLKSFGKIVAGLLVISGIVLLGAWIVGIQALSILYATDLTPLRAELMLILVGGIFLAMSGFYSAVLTIMRVQNFIPGIYLVGTVLSVLFTTPMTKSLGIRGAVLAFVISMALVACMLTILFARTLKTIAK